MDSVLNGVKKSFPFTSLPNHFSLLSGHSTLRPRGRSSGSVKNFNFSVSSKPALGSSEPPIQWLLEALSPGAKQQEREAD
jgi:hypothetical protein